MSTTPSLRTQSHRRPTIRRAAYGLLSLALVATQAPGDVSVFRVVSAAHAQDATATVEVEGVGADTDTASRQAWSAAVAEVVGTMVDARTVVVNNKLIQDQILVFSKGYVTRTETLSTSTENGLTRVRIRATVQRADIVRKIDDLRAQKLWVDGQSLVAEAQSKEEMDLQRANMLGAAISEYLARAEKAPQIKMLESPVIDGEFVVAKYQITLEWTEQERKSASTELKEKIRKLADAAGQRTDNRVDFMQATNEMPRSFVGDKFDVRTSVQKMCSDTPYKSKLPCTLNYDSETVKTYLVVTFRDANGNSVFYSFEDEKANKWRSVGNGADGLIKIKSPTYFGYQTGNGNDVVYVVDQFTARDPILMSGYWNVVVRIPIEKFASIRSVDASIRHFFSGDVHARPSSKVGYLGVVWVDIASCEDLGECVYLHTVVPNGPAAKAGLMAGDIVLRVGGIPVKNSTDLRHAVSAGGPGSIVDVVVMRRGQRVTVAITLGEQPSEGG